MFSTHKWLGICNAIFKTISCRKIHNIGIPPLYLCMKYIHSLLGMVIEFIFTQEMAALVSKEDDEWCPQTD